MVRTTTNDKHGCLGYRSSDTCDYSSVWCANLRHPLAGNVDSHLVDPGVSPVAYDSHPVYNHWTGDDAYQCCPFE